MHWIALQARPDAPPPESPPDAPAQAPGGASAPEALADVAGALGWWALRFTPKVALQGAVVLLEVSASERLFGGREPLLAQLIAVEPPLPALQHAQASTSRVALALLQTGQADARAPERLPLHTLAEARPHLATLERIGCRTWGDLRALPRGGIVRRFGAPLLDALDQACGLKPEVYPWLELPEVFDMPLELSAQVEAAPALLFAARRLLAQLQAWLRARRRGLLALELIWQMDARRDTPREGRLLLRTAEPTLDMQHLQRLLGEHLAQLRLPAPVLALRLRSHETAQLPGESASLLPDDLRPGDSLHQMLERLAARLGADQVLQAVPQADHRPEHMQRWQPADATRLRSAAVVAAEHAPTTDLYPTWLLAEPIRLAVHQDRPLYQGPLALLVGPQRLEAGWWGAGGQAAAGDTALRDYFLARSEQAGLLWIYRERLLAAAGDEAPARAAGQWYLHGLYG